MKIPYKRNRFVITVKPDDFLLIREHIKTSCHLEFVGQYNEKNSSGYYTKIIVDAFEYIDKKYKEVFNKSVGNVVVSFKRYRS